MQWFKNLSLKDKMAFLSIFKDEACDGPEAAAECLRTLDICVNETHVRLALLQIGWSEAYFHRLWEACPTHYGL